MKQYDYEIKNYAIVINSNGRGGHIDYIGKAKNKRQGNGFIVGNATIAYDFPYDIPSYVDKELRNILL